MTKLTELFSFEPRKSTLEVPCELVAGHHSKKYVHMSFRKTVMTEVKEGNSKIAVPVAANVELNVCQGCFNLFVYDMTKLARDVETQ
jgi:hypothetical protein